MTSVTQTGATRTRLALTRSGAWLTLWAFIALVAGLVVIPGLTTPSPRGISAAAAQGYDTGTAYWTAAGWMALTVLLFGVHAGARRTLVVAEAQTPLPSTSTTGIAGRLDWREIAVISLVFVAVYFPPFLSRYAPFSEDTYFLTSLQRLSCGQQPYRDFGFLYGPSLLHLPWWWANIFGFSLTSYYWLLALMQGVQFGALMGVLQTLVPDRRHRYLAFGVLASFLFNNLFGLNYDGTRWLIPSLALLLASLRPHDRTTNAWCAVLLGLHLSYSHEYALAALAAIGALHVALFVQGHRLPSIRAVTIVAGGSVLVWAVVTLLILGPAVPDYLRHARKVVGLMSQGHGGFRFYWTANSLALFAILTLACARLGLSFAGRAQKDDAGARLLLTAVVFTAITLKSGLNRSDLWHLAPAFIPLLFACVLPLAWGWLAPDAITRRILTALTLTASITFLVGTAPMVSLHATAYLRGAIDLVKATPRGSDEARAMGGGLERERTAPDPGVVALGRYLHAPARSGRPVLFYGRAWALPARIGVCPAHYKLDDLMYTEFTRPESDFLDTHPDALIVIRGDEYRLLFGPAIPMAPSPLSPMKEAGRWLSSVHYDAAHTERLLQDAARLTLTGRYVQQHYVRAAAFGDYLVLARP